VTNLYKNNKIQHPSLKVFTLPNTAMSLAAPNIQTRTALSEIIPGKLYLGEAGHAYELGIAKKLSPLASITRIINVTEFDEVPNYLEDVQGYEYLRIAVYDVNNEEIEEYFEAAYNFIEKAFAEGHKVLVHCYAGMSRSPTIVASYMMRKYDMSFEGAAKYISEQRDVTNFRTFRKKLQEYEKYLGAQKFIISK
jgi:protein-tyrosine phosphatase